ncbi:MAG: STAS domain-containing protein [Firmicutes bacterium]|jgi:rsbT co-antagonist protein RsbR|nr:STAS domain-containing protein [Bacillota bacterium]
MSQELEIQELKEQIKYYQGIIKNMASPIIPSVVPSTILVPIAGHMFKERFDSIRTNTLAYIGKHRDTEKAIFDFTGVTVEDIQAFDYTELTDELYQLNNSLKLMGVRPIYVGFNPRFVREIVQAGIQVELESHISFRAALQKLIKENNRSLNTLG